MPPAPQQSPATPRNRALWLATAGALVTLLGLWARCRNGATVFPAPGQVELGPPADSHYYVRFALLQLRSFPRFTTFDPFVNFPTGAELLWPPLHAWIVALAVWLGGAVTPERGAAWVGPAVSLVELAALAWLGLRLLGGARALAMLSLLALLPAMTFSGALGNADHHVHEPMFLAALSLTWAQTVKARDRRWAAASGALLGAARLFTPTAFVFVPLFAGASLAAAWLDRDHRREQASLGLLAGLVCAGILALAVVPFGSPRTLDYERLSWFQPLLALALFGGGAALARADTAERHRGRDLLGAAALGLLLLLPLAPQLVRALGHFGRADPLLALVVESEPLLRDPGWALDLLGPALLAAPFAVAGSVRLLRSGGEVGILPPLAASLGFLAAAGMQARFAQPLAGALAVLIPLGAPACLPAGLSAGTRRLAAAVALLGAASLLPGPRLLVREDPPYEVACVRPALRWMREHTPPAAADVLSPASRPAYGVAASYLLGHFVLLWAERPALATTFSQTGAHQAGNERAGAILAALDDDVAYERARASGVRYVVASPPYEMPGFPSLDPRRSLLARLTRNAGMATARDPATAHFRLIHGDGEPCGGAPGRPAARVFEVVPGAELAGEAPPGTEVQARLEVGGMDYRRTAVADSSGRFHLRVAYPTRGEAVAFGTSPVGYRLESGGRAANVQVDDRAVRWGEVLQTRLDPP